ncbi:hypothetical protein AAF712_007671 [Marasmius tenuissimus]|uniref:Cation/H+ exchanger transmembrane domain-containing protein n=1 Tax=Marasmius tenuissimus TaxID=585030 RepID=A0ABR2ZUE5_9AGAR
MAFYPFEVSIAHIIYACLGGFIVLFGMFSLFLREKLYIGEACWAFVFGIIIGPYGANIFDPRGWGNGDEPTSNMVTLEFTRVVLAIGVFAIGVELPKAYMARHWRSLLFLLGPVMTWGWFISAAFIFALVPGLNFLSALAVAACLTPTDPILAQAVVGGKYANKHVPAHIRYLLAAESGCNDGAAFPFLYIALYLILDHSTSAAMRDWFLILWLYQVIMGVVIGAFIGFSFRHLMKFCQKRDLIDRQSYVAQYLSLALFTIGVCTLLGTDDLLAAFSCGAAFAWDGFFNKQTEEAVFSSVIDLLFNIAAFIFVGAWMPFSSFQDPELNLSVWRLVVIAILVLLFRRLPIMLALYKWIPDVKTFREALFSGHFGPMGIGAVFISTYATTIIHHSDAPHSSQTQTLERSIQPITAFMVLCSILIHGLSIPSFSLSRRIHTVTRTWSRHTTIGNQLPDWTNHTTHVKRPEEVVINRDPVLRRANSVRSRDLESGIEIVDQEKPSIIHKTDSRESKGSANTRNTSEEERLVVRRRESVVEWLEGSHKVIERRLGPGEEVEVEVIKNYGSPHAEASLSRGLHASPAEHLQTGLSKLKHLVHPCGADATTDPEIIKPSPSAPPPSDGEVRQVPKSDVSTSASPPTTAATTRDAAQQGSSHVVDRYEEDDDDGWGSDRSADSDSGFYAYSLSSAQVVDDRERSSHRVSRPPLSTSSSIKGHRGRRVASRRNTGETSRIEIENTVEAQPQAQGDDEPSMRGRPVFTNVRNDSLISQNDNTRNQGAHLDGIRALRTLHSHPHVHRELSPSRSVRFREDPTPGSGRGSGTATPKYSSVFHFGSPGGPGEMSVPGTPPPERAD